MKFKFHATIAVTFSIAAACMLAGCKSTNVNLGVTTASVNTNGVLYIGSTAVDPAAAGLAIQFGAKYGAQALLKSQPDSRQYLAIAEGVIDAAIVSSNYSPASLQASLTSAMPTLNVTTAAAISSAISDGLDLYGVFYGQVVNGKIADLSPYLAPGLQGLANGIAQALVSVPAPTAVISTPAPVISTNTP
jgi:hypothetical protein